MERHNYENIPSQIKGKKLDITKERIVNDTADLKVEFSGARDRLLNISDWANLVDGASSTFDLVDKEGRSLERTPMENDYVRIDIPGPGPAHGHGFDWVSITKIDDRPEDLYTMITLQPAPPPDKVDSDKVAHFFKAYSSTTLIVKIEGKKLIVIYAGRNEEVNTENDQLMDTIRNMFVGFGAKIGLSHPQWEKLVVGILGAGS